MSFKAMSWAEDQRVGDARAKWVLMIYASLADERGWAYPSNAYLTEKTELNTKTVIAAVERLVHGQFLKDTGRRTGRTKQIPVYQLGMEGLPELVALGSEVPSDGADGAGEARTAPERESPPISGGLKTPNSSAKDTQIRGTEPIKEPNSPNDAKASFAPKGARKGRGSRIPEDWSAPPIDDLPPPARTVAAQWPAGAYEAEAVSFRDYWQSEGRSGARKHDWAKAWANRVITQGAKPIREAKSGLSFAAPGVIAANDADRPAAFDRLAVGAELIGNVDEAARYRAIAADLRGQTGIICERAPPT